jgi:hypothetical protein
MGLLIAEVNYDEQNKDTRRRNIKSFIGFNSYR